MSDPAPQKPPALTAHELDRLIGLVEHTERKSAEHWSSGDADLRSIAAKLRAMRALS